MAEKSGKAVGKILSALGRILLALLLLPPVLLFLLLLICHCIDDIALTRYRSEVLQELSLPKGSAVVETLSGCGNSSGTGNHTELVVGVLVRSEMEREEFLHHFPEALPVENGEFATDSMSALGMKISRLKEPGYHYYLEFIDSAPCSDLDLRGH